MLCLTVLFLSDMSRIEALWNDRNTIWKKKANCKLLHFRFHPFTLFCFFRSSLDHCGQWQLALELLSLSCRMLAKSEGYLQLIDVNQNDDWCAMYVYVYIVYCQLALFVHIDPLKPHGIWHLKNPTTALVNAGWCFNLERKTQIRELLGWTGGCGTIYIYNIALVETNLPYQGLKVCCCRCPGITWCQQLTWWVIAAWWVPWHAQRGGLKPLLCCSTWRARMRRCGPGSDIAEWWLGYLNRQKCEFNMI